MVLLVVLGGFGWFWVVLGRFGWFWVVPCFSNYDKDINTSGQFNMVNKNLTVICS